MKKYFVILSITITFLCSVQSNEPLPILFWHSAGESCCEKEFEAYASVIKRYLGSNTYIKSVQIGTSIKTDKLLSLTMHPFDQIEAACNDIKTDVNFSNGYNGIGLSQGALLLRGLAQTCNNGPKMRNLISLAGPQQGVYQYPNCGKIKPILCAGINKLIYSRPTQSLLAPATYWHDIVEERYLAGSTFLTAINNELEINEGYRNNLKSLQKLILVKYDQDTSIVPNESAFFGYFDSDKNVVPLVLSNLYQLDKLGLKSMDENGKLVFLTAPGAHLDLNEIWFVENILLYLRN
ncbi:hypothetical protein ACKWTF_001348 [Chironomus riparius]